MALHAKVAMYQAKWTDVKTYTDQVMGLDTHYSPIFTSYSGFRMKIAANLYLRLQCALILGNPAASNSQYSQVQGVRTVVGGGWGFDDPTQDLADAFETGDPRRTATIIFRGTTTPSGDPIPSTVTNPRYNMKSYVPFSLFVPGYNEGCQQNVRVIRYAEVLLMNAEANNELGNTSAALASLEMVRARARAGNNAILPPVTTTDQATLRTAIWHERRVEMAMEFDRYFDVIARDVQLLFLTKRLDSK